MLIGAHISVAGGYIQALEYALSIGAECAQIFAKSPRQWRGPAVGPEVASRFAKARAAAGFGPIFTHAAYLLNLATHDDVLWERSIDALADELARGSVLGAEGVVTHVGSDSLQDPRRASARISDAVCRAFERVGQDDSGVRLLLENTAGAGNSYGSTILQLANVIERTGLGPDAVGLCFDTCHAEAAGIPLETVDAWESVVEMVGREVGLGRFGLIHANDCMFPLGARRDRHAWIGDGTIGTDGFAAMFKVVERYPELTCLCAITEMPGDPPHKDVENLNRLRALRSEGRVSPL